MSKTCCVHKCPFAATRDGSRRFYRLPSKPYEKERRERWIAAIRRANPDGSQWMPNNNTRICSYHFVGNATSNVMMHPAYVPTIFPSRYRQAGASPEVRLARHNRWRQRLAAKNQCQSSNDTPVTNGLKAPKGLTAKVKEERMDEAAEATSSAPETQEPMSRTPEPMSQMQESISQTREPEPVDGRTNVQCTPDLEFITGDVNYATPAPRPVCVDQSTQATPPASPQRAVCVDQSAQAEPSTKSESSGSDRRTCWFAGYQTIKDSPDVLHDMCGVSPHAFQVLRLALPQQRFRFSDITIEDKLVVALMRLRLGITFSSLGALFAMHPSTASRTFLGILDALNEATRDWIAPPSERPPLSSFPEWVKQACPDCRYITHFLEVRTEAPPTTEQRRAMSSKLVKNHTLKFLLAFAPNGDICFVSKGFGGRTTEASVIADSGFLDLVDAGDIIVSHDGFLRVDAAPDGTKFVALESAPTTGKTKRTENEEDQSYGSLQVREHVKRMVQRIRTYRILEDRLPSTMIAHADAICEVCCVLANLQPNLFKPINAS
ncbi:unnamed protein product [Ixodes hexagonus]